MIKLTSYRIPKYLQRFRKVDPIVLLRCSENPKHINDLNLWEFVMNELRVNGVYKKTYNNRLEISTLFLYEFFKSTTHGISFLDVGASDGSSSFYTHHYLKNRGIVINTISTDKYTTLLYNKNFFLRYYFTEEYIPFLCVIMNVFSVDLYKQRDFLSNVIANKLNKLFKIKQHLIHKGTILLIHPEITTDEFFKYESMDVFEINNKFINKFYAIRCSNLLQLVYFDRSQIIKAIDILKLYLKDNGLLIITKNITGETKESGVVFQKKTGELDIIHRFSTDSEIEMVIKIK